MCANSSVQACNKNSSDISYFDISWASSFDGPGTRVVLYLLGCQLRCPWCHSPHTWERSPKLMFFENSCLLCGSCEKACPNNVHKVNDDSHQIDRLHCEACGRCVDACPTVISKKSLDGALLLTGQKDDPKTLFRRMEPQLALLKDIGGLTHQRRGAFCFSIVR